MTYQKLFISKKSPNSHLIILMKVFIHGRFFKKTFSGPEKWRVALYPTVVVTAFFVEEEYVLECIREWN